MLRNLVYRLCALLAPSASALLTPGHAAAAEPQPVLLKPEGQQFKLVKNWTFGHQRPDATVHNKAELDQDFFYRYFWDGGKLDKFKTYWSYHRDYPEGDAKSLHVFDDHALVLKGRIPDGGGLKDRGLESGMLRAKMPIKPGMYLEMRAKLSGGVGAWPSFWLGEGVQNADGTFSKPPKALPEIDIFEFFNWDGRPQTRVMVCNIQTFSKPAAYGYPYDLYTTLRNAGYERNLDVGFDASKEFHVYALDWVENQPIWLLDGKPIKQTYYEWHGSPAHLLVINSLGIRLPGVKQTQMIADEKQWDYAIDYIRVWERKAGAVEIPGPIAARPARKAQTLNAFEKTGGHLSIAATGRWENPTIAGTPADAAKLKANPVLKVDVTVPAETEDAGWLNVKLAMNGDGMARTESPNWLLDRHPGKGGIRKETLTWDLSEVADKLPQHPNWFKIELVTQGDRARTIDVSNVRAEGEAAAVKEEPAKPTAPKKEPAAAPAPAATDGPTLYPNPNKEQDWPGKGPIRSFDFMVGERKAFWAKRQQDQGAVVFVGDSLTGGWKNLAQDFPKLKVANRGVGGDVSRGVLFRLQEDVLDLHPKAVVIEIGNNDLTATGAPVDMLSNLAAIVAKVEKVGLPVILCTIPPSANPKAPIKAESRQAMNVGIKKLAAENPSRNLCDLYTALANEDGSPKLEYFMADKLHMSDAGHRKWAELLTPIFEKLKLE